jgi:hypothetical protein
LERNISDTVGTKHLKIKGKKKLGTEIQYCTPFWRDEKEITKQTEGADIERVDAEEIQSDH